MPRGRHFLLGLTLACIGGPAAAEARFALSAELLEQRDGHVGLDHAWRYHDGDNPAWAAPSYDDSAWESANPALERDAMPTAGFSKVGWFRLRLSVDPALFGELMAFQISHLGAIEIYVDGERVAARGNVDAVSAGADQPIDVHYVPEAKVRLTRTEHVLAIRYASTKVATFQMAGWPAGVRIALCNARGASNHQAFLRFASAVNLIYVGAAVSLGALHLFVFAFYRERRENIYFALMTFAAAGIAYSTTMVGQLQTVAQWQAAIFIFKLGICGASTLGLRCYYEMFRFAVPRYYWGGVVAGVAMVGASAWVPTWAFYVYSMLHFVAEIHVLVDSLRRRIAGAWIIAIGGMAVVSLTTVTMIVDYLRLQSYWTFSYLLGFFALLESMSIYLAQSIARDKRALAAQLIENQRLSEVALRRERQARTDELQRKELAAENARQELLLDEAQKREVVLNQLEKAHAELRQTQAQLVHSEKMAAMGQLVAGLTHEINSPLGAIGSTHASLRQAVDKLRAALAEQGRDRVDNGRIGRPLQAIDDAAQIIAGGSQRIEQIVTRLKGFARLDEAGLKPAEINRSIEDTLGLLKPQLFGDRIKVATELGNLPAIACYPRQLNQVLANLVTNAVQAIEGRGEIHIRSWRDDSWIKISVRDTGTGIAAEHRERIFDPGFTTRGVRVGAGLGLAICDRVIKAHHGEITVDTHVGRGTTFTIALPTTLPQPAQLTAASPRPCSGSTPS